jgi:hypothetical protein
MHWLNTLRFGTEFVLELLMATVDSDKVVCRGIHAMIVAVLVKAVKVSHYLPVLYCLTDLPYF